ncbi:MAG: hypothetical protein KDA25_07990, partial [Phycisphaerales bacterium]|nr:hypothetical protein [Phycisphaerales bacterium]
MKKVLRRVVVCGLLGLVTSIVVAYVAPMLQYHPWLDGHTHDALIVNGYRVNRSASFGKTSLILGDAGDGPGVMIPPDAARSARDVARTVVTTGLSPDQFAQVVQQGLPLRCVEAWHAPTQTWGVWVPGRRGVFLPLRP